MFQRWKNALGQVFSTSSREPVRIAYPLTLNYHLYLVLICRSWCSKLGYCWVEWMYMIDTRIGGLMLIICHMRCLIFSSCWVSYDRSGCTRWWHWISGFCFPFQQELLELGDRIGYVSTGLREDEIIRSLRKVKHSTFDASTIHFSSEMEWKCSICQVSYFFPGATQIPFVSFTFWGWVLRLLWYRKNMKQMMTWENWSVVIAIIYVA